MRFRTVFLIMELLHISNTLTCMSHSHTQETSHTQNKMFEISLDQHSVRLCHDVFSIIVSYVLKQKTLSRCPSFDKASPIIETNYKALAQDQLSSNWNKLIMKDYYTPEQPLYIFKIKEKIKNAHSLETVTIDENEKKYSTSFSILEYNNSNHQSDFCFDGPNDEGLLLVSCNTSSTGNTNTYLIKLTDKLEKQELAGHISFSKTSLLGHKRHCIALASKKMYVVASQVRNAHRHWLSWFTFDQTRNTMLTTQIGLGVSLKKIAFLINSTLMGLTTDGKMQLYWLDKNNKLQSAQQKIPYKVIDFAVDPVQKGFIVMALHNEKMQLACADIRHKNAAGQILFQCLEGETYSKQITNGILTYYNNTICHGENPGHWQKPYSMFQVFPKTRLKKALCSKSN